MPASHVALLRRALCKPIGRPGDGRDRRHRAPRYVVVLRIKRGDIRVCHGDVYCRQYQCVLLQRSMSLCTRIKCNPVPAVTGRARIPELARESLVCRAGFSSSDYQLPLPHGSLLRTVRWSTPKGRRAGLLHLVAFCCRFNGR